MRKFFLIPVLALFTCVSAWGTPTVISNVSGLQEALSSGGDYVLGANIDASGAALNLTTTLTLDLGGYTLTLPAANPASYSYGLSVTGSLTITGSGTVAGGQITVTGFGGSNYVVFPNTFMGMYMGTLASIGGEYMPLTSTMVPISGGMFSFDPSSLVVDGYQANEVAPGMGIWSVTAASGGSDPEPAGSNVAYIGSTHYTTLEAAFAAAANNSTITLEDNVVMNYEDDEESNIILINDGRNITLDLNGHNITGKLAYWGNNLISIQQGSLTIQGTGEFNVTEKSDLGVSAVDDFDRIIAVSSVKFNGLPNAMLYLKGGSFALEPATKDVALGYKVNEVSSRYNIVEDEDYVSLAAYLTGSSSEEYVVDRFVDITSAAIVVSGTKTIRLTDDAIIKYQRFSGTYVDNINVPVGAKLTILGNGTFVGNNRAVATVGGELVIGPQDKSTQPHFKSTRTDAGCVIQANGGLVTINNADVYAGAIALWTKNGGRLIVNDGRFEAECAQTVNVAVNSYYEQNGGTIINNTSTKHGTYSYAVMVQGHAVFNDGLVSGVHGGVDVSYWQATAEINGGTYETRPCIYGGSSHYALYASTYGVATVRGGKFKSADKQAVFCGNNDAFSEIGVVNIYGGEFATKAYVQYAPTNTFPASVPTTSQWYSSFGTDAPLPAGYEYQEITEGADYEAGYRYQVVCTNPNTDAIDDSKLSEPTIPWQQPTTWASDEVPEDNTIVTIPAGATVVVSNSETDKTAEAEQVFINQGADLTVETGTTLTVGEGGLNIANGGSLTVEAGATVKIGSAGVITTEEDALVIESNDDVQGVLLYDPAVAENTQPKATVKLTTKAKQIGDQSYVFERFAIPTVDGAETTYKIEGGVPTSGLYNDAPSFLQAIWAWNHTTNDWEQLTDMHNMQPFQGYQLTNNSANGGLVYIFEGNLVGNQDKSYDFVANGFHFFGNSYTADINIKNFLQSLGSSVEKTVWVYDPYDKTFKTITERLANGRVKYGNGDPIEDVRSMQAFLMYLSDGTSGTAAVDYESAIWGNPKYNGGAAPAPARYEATNEDWATIRVSSANGLKDEVILNQNEEFTSAFENGADANKYMNNENINLYAATNAGNLAVVATNDLSNTVLTFAAGNATEYTLQFADVEGYEFTLRDNVTGATVLMSEGATYEFTQEANTTVQARFEVINAPQVITGIENVEETAKATGVYTVTGQYMGRDFSKLPAGVYVVNGVKIVK